MLQIRLQETNIAIAYEQQGYFEQAQGAYELAMTKFRNDYNGQASPIGVQQVSRRHGQKLRLCLFKEPSLVNCQAERQRKIYIQTCNLAERQTNRQEDMQTDLLSEIQTNRQKDKQLGKKAKMN